MRINYEKIIQENNIIILSIKREFKFYLYGTILKDKDISFYHIPDSIVSQEYKNENEISNSELNSSRIIGCVYKNILIGSFVFKSDSITSVNCIYGCCEGFDFRRNENKRIH